MKIEQLEVEKKNLQFDLKQATLQKDENVAKYEALCQEREAQTKEKESSLSSKTLLIDLLCSEKEELQRQVKELTLANAAGKEKEELHLKESEIRDLKRKISTLERQAEDIKKTVKSKDTALELSEKKIQSLTSHLEEVKNQIKMKTNQVEALEKEKKDLERKLDTLRCQGKSGCDSTSRMEVKSRLVERLQSEKAELQRQLEQMEKERDVLKSSAPDRQRDSSSRNSLIILRESGYKLRADLEDKVQRLERVVTELEGKLTVSSTLSSIDRNALKKEIEELRLQIQLSTEAETQEIVSESEHESVKRTRDKYKQQVEDLQKKIEELTEDKHRLQQSAFRKMETEKENRALQEKIAALEKEKKDLNAKCIKLSSDLTQLQEQLKKEKTTAQEEMDRLKTVRPSSFSNNKLVGDLTRDKQLLETKVKGLERQVETLQVNSTNISF